MNKADGFIILRDNPLEMLYFNRDGSLAPMCGNGVRCFAKFGFDLGIIKDKNFVVKTTSGNVNLEITSIKPFTVKVDLGKPYFAPEKLGIHSQNNQFINEIISIGDTNISVNEVFMNTHHLVIFLEAFNDILELAEEIHCHPIFTEKINVNFVKVVNNHKLIIKTYERGVGWTLACGTGAASAYVIGKILGYINDYADVESIGGILRISSVNEHIIMEGPVITVKEPKYESTT